MTQGWYVARVYRGREKALEQQLNPLGVAVYHPKITVNKAGRRHTEPLFPSYVFCECDPQADTWIAVRRAYGLKYFLGSEDEPTAIDPVILQVIESRVDEWNAGGWKNAFAPSEKVIITAGPFKGLQGIFVKYIPARERCRILVSSINSRHTVEIDAALLTSASRSVDLPHVGGRSFER